MSWSETDMLEIFGRRYEYLSQKEFDAARKSHRVDFGGCLFDLLCRTQFIFRAFGACG